ncbi:dihydrolipoamide acetyltransferase family protein [Streptomyces sp. NPDC056628]|uniref:dihydrolipoamide acetyltransferase family protein n=1 Tax=Streptomyces sp. NPDC056628 TaxID=3345882 RepID=UPI0036A0C6D7
MAEFTMPSLGADMDEGTLVEWLAQPGDTVHKGDPVAVVETAKSTIEVECFESGTVAEQLVEPGATVPVGTPLAVISASGREGTEAVRKIKPATRHPRKRSEPVESAPASSPPSPPPSVPPPSPRAAPGASPPPPSPAAVPATGSASGHFEAGPLVRHLAEHSGVDLGALHGTGPGGRVTRTDVEKATGARLPRVRVTPLARRLAAELGIDPATLTGTGKDSAVRASDVRRAASGAAAPARTIPAGTSPPAARPTAAAPSDGKATAMRRAIAGLMSRANRDIPHYYLSTTVDMAAATQWLRDHNRRVPVGERVLPAALLLKAAALAAREVPELNGHWTDDRFTAAREVNLGVAVSLRGGGLVAPTLRDADALELPRLMALLKDVVTRARTGRLRASEVSDATITVTNLGDQGVESVLGVIYPPQVALVGFGRVTERPWAVEGMLGVRPVVTATLSADHRATDGAVGARYLTAVARLLQHPEQL